LGLWTDLENRNFGALILENTGIALGSNAGEQLSVDTLKSDCGEQLCGFAATLTNNYVEK